MRQRIEKKNLRLLLVFDSGAVPNRFCFVFFWQRLPSTANHVQIKCKSNANHMQISGSDDGLPDLSDLSDLTVTVAIGHWVFDQFMSICS